MKYALIEADRGCLSVQRACRVLRVSVSGYYAWQQRCQHAKANDVDERLVAHIRAVFADSRGTYGSPRVTAALRQQGIVCNHKRVARLMRQQQLVAKHRRQRRVKTTDSRHAFPIAPTACSGTSPRSVRTRNGWRTSPTSIRRKAGCT